MTVRSLFPLRLEFCNRSDCRRFEPLEEVDWPWQQLHACQLPASHWGREICIEQLVRQLRPGRGGPARVPSEIFLQNRAIGVRLEVVA